MSFAELFDGDRFEHFHHLVRRRALGDEPSERSAAQSDVLPCRIVEARSVPSGNLATRIVMFARIQHVDDGTLRRLPRFVAGNDLLRTVFVHDMELSEETRRPVGFHPVDLRVVETVPQHGPDHVLALLQHVGHIVTEVHHPILPELVVDRNHPAIQPLALIVVRLVGHQHVVAHLATVQVELEIAEPRSEKAGRGHLLVYSKRFTHHRRRGRHFASGIHERLLALPRRTDPAAFPLGGIEHAHRPTGRLAPRRGLALSVPDTHLPPVGPARAERLAPVFHQRGLSAFHLFAIPRIGLAGEQVFFRGSHPDLPCALCGALRAFGRPVDPREPGLGHVHDRSHTVLAGQSFRNDTGDFLPGRRRTVDRQPCAQGKQQNLHIRFLHHIQ